MDLGRNNSEHLLGVRLNQTHTTRFQKTRHYGRISQRSEIERDFELFLTDCEQIGTRLARFKTFDTQTSEIYRDFMLFLKDFEQNRAMFAPFPTFDFPSQSVVLSGNAA